MAAEVESANCECCGLTEECTPAYIALVSGRFRGWWICGLCSAAVDDEIGRSDGTIGVEEALDRHMRFCGEFRAAPPPDDSTEHLISAMSQVMRRSLDSPARVLRSTPNTPRPKSDAAAHRPSLGRAESCLTTFAS